MHGPTSLRRNDTTLLRISDINNRIGQVQSELPEKEQLITFGDNAYQRDSHMNYYKLKHYAKVLSAAEFKKFKDWNDRMKSVRITIEWSYGVTASLFKYVQTPEKLKLMQTDHLQKVYVVATYLFRHIHLALYRGKPSNYFNVRLPDNFVRTALYQ
jgi:hypothetical protein